jgi:hypothetical protein
MDRTISSVYAMAKILALKKNEQYLNSEHSGRLMAKDTRGLPTRFPKGHVPSNRGKKWWQYLSLEQYHNQLKTSFRKGRVPLNHKPVGSTRINIYGYIEKKTAEPNKWELLHRLVWKEHQGDIPAGMNVQFRDGNSQNCDISNLYLASRRENMAQNTIHQYPEDIKSAFWALGKLKREIEYGKK